MRILGICACAFLAVAGTAQAANRVVLPTNVTPSHYDIQIATNAAQLSFTGSVRIDVDAKQSAKTITLNAADLVFAKVSLSGAAAAPKVAYDAKEQTATLTFGQACRGRPPRARHRLHAARSTSRPPASSPSTTTRPTARSARSSPSSRTPTRAASSRPGTSPTRRRPSRSPPPCPPTRWRSPTCRSPSTESLARRAQARDASRRRRRCRPICCSSALGDFERVTAQGGRRRRRRRRQARRHGQGGITRSTRRRRSCPTTTIISA